MTSTGVKTADCISIDQTSSVQHLNANNWSLSTDEASKSKSINSDNQPVHGSGQLSNSIENHQSHVENFSNEKTNSELYCSVKKSQTDGRLNGVVSQSHSVCTGGDNGLTKQLTDSFGGARPKAISTDNTNNAKSESISPSDCEKKENSCDISDKSSACVERDKQVDNLLVQLEKTSLKSGGETGHSDVSDIDYFVYESEKQMPDIMRLITKDLSEPYSIYTYRYFIHNWPKLCFLAKVDGEYVGAIVCKLDVHKKLRRRGYIAMLAVDSRYRRRAIGSTLVTKAIQAMIRDDCDEVVLETEISNMGALHLYQNLGFVRDKRLFRYYLNGVDALRLKLWLR